jgi:hypothetical protein
MALIAIAFLRRWPNRRFGPVVEYALSFAAALLLGAIVELVQAAIGRDAEVGDLLRDGLGAAAALGILAFFDQDVSGPVVSRRLRAAGLFVGLAATVMLVTPLLVSWLAYRERNREFPVLADFDRPFITYFVATLADVSASRAAVPTTLIDRPGRTTGLQIAPSGRRWWGVALREPRADWSQFERVMLSIANPSPVPLRVRVRLFDDRHQSGDPAPFSANIVIEPASVGTAAVALRPTDDGASRPALDLANIHSLMIARAGKKPVAEFYLLRVWLE